MNEHHVSVEEVNEHLKEVDDLVATQREIDAALGEVSFLLFFYKEIPVSSRASLYSTCKIRLSFFHVVMIFFREKQYAVFGIL